MVYFRLIEGVRPVEFFCYGIVNLFHGVENALSLVPFHVAIAHFQRFVLPCRGSGGYGGPAPASVLEIYVYFNRGVAARIQNFPAVYECNSAHI